MLTYVNYRNINVFALSFIIAVFCVFTILDLVLLKFLIFLQRFRRALAPRIDQWIQDGIFQIQRKAYEAYSQATWDGKRLEKDIPATISADALDRLPLELRPLSCKCASSPTHESGISKIETSITLTQEGSIEDTSGVIQDLHPKEAHHTGEWCPSSGESDKVTTTASL